MPLIDAAQGAVSALRHRSRAGWRSEAAQIQAWIGLPARGCGAVGSGQRQLFRGTVHPGSPRCQVAAGIGTSRRSSVGGFPCLCGDLGRVSHADGKWLPGISARSGSTWSPWSSFCCCLAVRDRAQGARRTRTARSGAGFRASCGPGVRFIMVLLRSGHAGALGFCDASSRPHYLARAIAGMAVGGRRTNGLPGGTLANWLIAGCGLMLTVLSAIVERRQSDHGRPCARPVAGGRADECAARQAGAGPYLRVRRGRGRFHLGGCGGAGAAGGCGDDRGGQAAGAGDASASGAAGPAGSWGRAIAVPGLGALNKRGAAEVTSVSCASAGNCAAGGHYADRHGNQQGFVASERNGRWGTAIEVPGLGALNPGGYADVVSVSCGSAGNCAAGGYYAWD